MCLCVTCEFALCAVCGQCVSAYLERWGAARAILIFNDEVSEVDMALICHGVPGGPA